MWTWTALDSQSKMILSYLVGDDAEHVLAFTDDLRSRVTGDIRSTQPHILGMLCEGMSMRAISRLADVSINTMSKLLVDAGLACGASTLSSLSFDIRYLQGSVARPDVRAIAPPTGLRSFQVPQHTNKLLARVRCRPPMNFCGVRLPRRHCGPRRAGRR